MWNVLLLASLKRFTSIGVLAIRLLVGAFLLWATWDVLPNEARLRGFAAYLAKFHFPVPYLMARLSIYAQAFIGASFIAGLCTRWAGLLCAAHFAVALVMIERYAGIRGAFPVACLMAIGLFLAFHGAGRFGLDALLETQTRKHFDDYY